MVYLEKYDVYIDNDLVVYRVAERNSYGHRKGVLYRLKFSIDKDGYLHTSCNIKGNIKNLHLHRIVAEAFIPNPENKISVDHINRNKLDNRIENLRWASCKEQELNKDRTIRSMELHDGFRCKVGTIEEKRTWRRKHYALHVERFRANDHERYERDREKRKSAAMDYYARKKLTHKRVLLSDGKKHWIPREAVA
jgi:hypothetical protein